VTRDWILDALGRPSFDKLATRLPASRVWSGLLEIMRHRAARPPADVLRQYERDPFTRPSVLDPRIGLAIDQQLFAAAAEFDAIELSPVAPLGTCSAISLVHQHKILSALRGTEVIADPTNCLALEAALRLRHHPTTVVRLATSARVVRCQPAPDRPGYARHFRLFGLVTAGREAPEHQTSVAGLVDHVRAIWRALDLLEQHGYRFGARRIALRSIPARAPIADRVATALSDLPVEREPLDHPYYDGVRYMVFVTSPAGEAVPLIDGGLVDWVAKLTSNRSHVGVVSGMGSQLVGFLFRA